MLRFFVSSDVGQKGRSIAHLLPFVPTQTLAGNEENIAKILVI
jgi:hypothetical protein